MVLDGEAELGARALADPIALNLLDAVGPVDGVESVEQPIRVGRDAHHPLAHLLAHHRMAAPLTEPPHDFIVGEHRAEGRTPVDLAVSEVGEAVRHQDAIAAGHIEPVPLVRSERTVKTVAPCGASGFKEGVLPDRPIQVCIAGRGKDIGQGLNGAGLVRTVVVPVLEQAGENPLGPAIVVRAARSHLSAPVVAESE